MYMHFRLTRISVGDLGRLVGIEPDLSFTNFQDTSSETLLKSSVRPRKHKINIRFEIGSSGKWMATIVHHRTVQESKSLHVEKFEPTGGVQLSLNILTRVTTF